MHAGHVGRVCIFVEVYAAVAQINYMCTSCRLKRSIKLSAGETKQTVIYACVYIHVSISHILTVCVCIHAYKLLTDIIAPSDGTTSTTYPPAPADAEREICIMHAEHVPIICIDKLACAFRRALAIIIQTFVYIYIYVG